MKLLPGVAVVLAVGLFGCVTKTGPSAMVPSMESTRVSTVVDAEVLACRYSKPPISTEVAKQGSLFCLVPVLEEHYDHPTILSKGTIIIALVAFFSAPDTCLLLAELPEHRDRLRVFIRSQHVLPLFAKDPIEKRGSATCPQAESDA